MNDRHKTLVSLFGDLDVASPYYHCPACHHGLKPWERKLRIGKRRVTAAAAEAISLAGLLTSFGRAQSQTLKKLTGIRVSESTVRRVTEDAGEALAAAQVAKKTFGPDKSWKWQHDARNKTCGYASLDHVSVPQQGPHGARAEGRMAAVAMVYNPQSKHDEKMSRTEPQVRYLSGFYEFPALGLQLRRQAAQVGWDELGQQLSISDAGSGLEDFMRVNFPLAERILDFYHASEHVANLARAVHPQNEAERTKQLTNWCHQLKHEGGAAVRREFEQLDVTSWGTERLETHRVELQYFRNHEHRMDYPRYLANGWQIGSGSVESGCKRVVTQRLKGAGMRWGPRGGNAMCHLHALLLSEPGQWEGFWSQNPPAATHLQI
jgi:hypothetical protein